MTEKILLALTCALLIACAVLGARNWGLSNSLAKSVADNAALKADHARQVTDAVLAARDEGNRIINVQRKALDVQFLETQAARADADRAVRSHGIVRDQLARIKAERGSASPGAAPADSREAVDLLTEVLGSCVAEYRLLAVEADRARTAGAYCERSYDALIPPAKN